MTPIPHQHFGAQLVPVVQTASADTSRSSVKAPPTMIDVHCLPSRLLPLQIPKEAPFARTRAWGVAIIVDPGF